MNRLNNIIFSLFITFSTFNLYSIELISTFGRYGKTIIILYIIIYFIWKILQNDLTIIINKYIILIFILSISFFIGAFNNYIDTNRDNYFMSAVIFSIYLIYFYSYIDTLLYFYGDNAENEFFIILKKVIYLNFIIGFLVAILFSVDMMVFKKGSYYFGGFLGDGLFFAWYSLVAFFITIFSNNGMKKDKGKLLLFLIFIFTSGGRGAEMTIIIYFLVYSFILFISYFHNKYIILISKILISPFLLFILYIFIYTLNSESMNSITTGRWFIWTLAIKEIIEHNIYYFGWGLEGLADFILEKYHNQSYYFMHLYSNKGTLYLHSSYLAILAAGGLLSLLSFLWLNYLAIKDGNHMIKAFFISLLFAGLIEQFHLSANIPISTLFWLLIFFTALKTTRTDLIENKGILK